VTKPGNDELAAVRVTAFSTLPTAFEPTTTMLRTSKQTHRRHTVKHMLGQDNADLRHFEEFLRDSRNGDYLYFKTVQVPNQVPNALDRRLASSQARHPKFKNRFDEQVPQDTRIAFRDWVLAQAEDQIGSGFDAAVHAKAMELMAMCLRPNPGAVVGLQVTPALKRVTCELCECMNVRDQRRMASLPADQVSPHRPKFS
jgi:hypothetical protein